jgi:hypothetical protein
MRTAKAARRGQSHADRGAHRHRTGRLLPGMRHLSTRAGGLPARIRKRVYLPIRAPLRTYSSRVTPARSLRSKRWMRTSEATLEAHHGAGGHPRPRHRASTLARAARARTGYSPARRPEARSRDADDRKRLHPHRSPVRGGLAGVDHRVGRRVVPSCELPRAAASQAGSRLRGHSEVRDVEAKPPRLSATVSDTV